MSTGTPGPLLQQAALLRVDIYPADVACDGNHVAASAGAPRSSINFQQGEALTLDVSPGRHTVVLTAFADASGSQPLGSACASADFQPGQSVCLDLTVEPVGGVGSDGGGDDLSVPPDLTSCADCCASDEECGTLLYCSDGRCAPGCKSATDCGQADGGGGPLCDTSSHTCVECLTSGDCSAGKLCSASGACVDGCTTDHPCASGRTCCDGLCADLTSDAANCGGCGKACDTAQSNGASCKSSKCQYSGCKSGYADCTTTSPNSDGCETSTTTITNCGGCGNKCDTASSNGAACNGTSCAYQSCVSGRINCNTSSPDVGGCECVTDPAMPACCTGGACQAKHDTGISKGSKTSWFDCTALDSWTEAQARTACATFIGSTSGYHCNQYDCGGGELIICADPDSCPGSLGGDPCWAYAGDEKGHVFFDTTCELCPGTGDPKWH